MESFLHKKFINNLIRHLNIQVKTPMLLAISGGQDSLCLLKLFIDLYKQYKFQLGIVHINHQWRHDSICDTYHIINMINTTQIPIYVYQIQPKNFSELESRIIRYQLILEIAIKHNYRKIVTAHSASDQIETCLYNLLRGTNGDGLNSLKWKRKLHANIQIIRPILNFTRSEIMWFCKFFSLPYWSDTSNQNYTITRNRVRQELIPYLQFYFKNSVENNISNFLQKNYWDSEYLKQNTIKIYRKIKHPKFIAINQNQLLLQHKAIQYRVLQYFCLYNLNKTISTSIITQILHHLTHKYHITVSFNSFIIHNFKEWLYIAIKK